MASDMIQPLNPKALLLLLLSVLASHGFAQGTVKVPLKSEITKVQPMTGIVLWSDNSSAAKHPSAIALEYRYCGYNEVVGEDGKYDWSKIDQTLDEIASRNHQAILRFYFCYVGKPTTVPDFIRSRPDYEETVGKSEKKTTHFCDWRNSALQEFTLDFYSKFADRYDRDPRLAFLQTGFGLWAEYHIYDGPRKIGKTFPDKRFQERFLRHLDTKFEQLPWSISVDAADYDYTPLEDNDELLALNFGVFDDSFLCKQHPRENAMNWKTLGLDRWQRQPGGGEFSYYNKRDQKNALSVRGPNGVSFETAAKQFHISYMIGDDQPRYQSVERIREAGMSTGYRFHVESAELDGTTLRLNVVNKGVAPIYRDAWFAVGKQRSQTSLKGLLPEQSRVFQIQNVRAKDATKVRIQSDTILPSQQIQFHADLDG